MGVKLKNIGKSLQVHNLDHRFVCSKDECFCSTLERVSVELNPATGDRGVRISEILAPKSLYITCKETSEELPEGVLQVPSIARAVALRELIVVS